MEVNPMKMIIDSCHADDKEYLRLFTEFFFPGLMRPMKHGDTIFENDDYKIVFDFINEENGKLMCTQTYKHPAKQMTVKVEGTIDLFNRILEFRAAKE